MTEQELELLSAYLDNALSEADRADLERRLQTEPNLQFELEQLRATVRLIQALPELRAPRDFTITSAQADRIRRQRTAIRNSRLVSIASAAAAFVLLVIAVSMLSLPQQMPEQSSSMMQVAAVATQTSAETVVRDSISTTTTAGTVPATSPTETNFPAPFATLFPTVSTDQALNEMELTSNADMGYDLTLPTAAAQPNNIAGSTFANSSETAAESAVLSAPQVAAGDTAGGIASQPTDTPKPPTGAPTATAAPTAFDAQPTLPVESRAAQTSTMELTSTSVTEVADSTISAVPIPQAEVTTESVAPVSESARQTDQAWLSVTLLIISAVLFTIAVLIWIGTRRHS